MPVPVGQEPIGANDALNHLHEVRSIVTFQEKILAWRINRRCQLRRSINHNPSARDPPLQRQRNDIRDGFMRKFRFRCHRQHGQPPNWLI